MKKYHKTILEIAKEKDITILTSQNEINDAIDELDISPFHSESGTKEAVKKIRKKKERVKATNRYKTEAFFD